MQSDDGDDSMFIINNMNNFKVMITAVLKEF